MVSISFGLVGHSYGLVRATPNAVFNKKAQAIVVYLQKWNNQSTLKFTKEN
jgi:hypothetical protein